jgi:signal transduction histidine kinase
MAIWSNAVACLRWLDDDQLDVARARQAAERIIGDGRRARDVIANMRMLTRKAPPETAAFSLNDVIKEVTVLTRNEMERHAIVAELDLASDLEDIQGVRVQIQQVLLNLVVNAVEAIADTEGESPRQILIRSARHGAGEVRAHVEDSGPGLDRTSFEKIFEAFFTTKSEGLGLGLSICRSIIETHGGRLWAAANAPRGCVFSFSLPAPHPGGPR